MIPTFDYAAEGGFVKLRRRKDWIYTLKGTGRFCRSHSGQVLFKIAENDWMHIAGAAALAAILSDDDLIRLTDCDLESPEVQKNLWMAVLEFKHHLNRIDKVPPPVAHLAPQDRYARPLDSAGR